MLSSNRSCTNLRGISLHAGKPNDLYVGPTQAHCCFQLHRDGQATTINLDQAHCRLEVVPALGDNGRILLHFTPLVRHGEPTLATRPTQDPSGSRYWDRKVEQPSESYTWLSWDLSVAENEYVLVGCRPERGDTLGACCFLDTEAATPTQRLLVLRVGRGPEDVPPEDEAVARSAPLALQASWTAHSP
jgi:hypothetical protein